MAPLRHGVFTPNCNKTSWDYWFVAQELKFKVWLRSKLNWQRYMWFEVWEKVTWRWMDGWWMDGWLKLVKFKDRSEAINILYDINCSWPVTWRMASSLTLWIIMICDYLLVYQIQETNSDHVKFYKKNWQQLKIFSIDLNFKNICILISFLQSNHQIYAEDSGK